ncbi:SPOR domain-containing protein [Granulosicoccus sp. 3-233]|uniref:SPOR domain-containing protein n=1 Tax=Granulosicoccus sp. 3-233 TaxID=3417969 RepID=UPI003D353BCC
MFADGDFIQGWKYLFVLLCIAFGTQALSATAELKLENELLLELRVDGERLGLDILGYQRGDDFLLSLDELASGLGFPIVVDGQQGTASGWYLSEDRPFSLELQRGTVISGDSELPIGDGEAVLFQGEVFVETRALEKWFPLRLSAVVRELFLDVEPLEPLPLQLRSDRRERVFNRTSAYQEPQYPLQETPYQLMGPHTTKLRLGYSTVRQTPDSPADYGSNYALLSRGDLGWMTSTLALAGQSGESLTGARMKLERTAFDGPLGLDHVEVGDVDVGGYRGLLLRGGGRRDEGGRIDTESVSLEGSQLPDWDVELYQNDQLLMIQTTGPEGRYLFEDVPLQFGQNRFELKFFGPNGEMESREEYHYLGVGMLEPGRVSYELSAVQSGRTVLGVNDSNGEGDRDSGLYTGELNFGLSRNMTLGAGIRSVEQDGERNESRNLSIGLSTSRLYGNVRYVDAANSQNSIGTSLRTQLGDTSLGLGFTRFLEETELPASPQKWSSNVNITSSVRGVPFKVEVNAQEQETSSAYDAVIGATTPLAGSGRFSSSLWYTSVEEQLDGIDTRTSQTGGLSSFHTTIRPWSFRLAASYGLAPETELLELSADSNLRIERNMSLDLSISQNALTDTTYYRGGINWLLDQVAINASVSYDSDERWGGLITLSTGLVHQPGTLRPILDSRASVSAGSVDVRVFERASGLEDRPIAGVGVKGVQAWRHATTDDNGSAYLSRMPAYLQVDIELDESTLVDGELRSRNPGVSVIPRPGSFAVVEFPVIRTAELEGHVLMIEGDQEKPVSRVLVSLKTSDGELVAQRRTAFDGFYLFDGIEPGGYRISLEDPLGRRLLKQPGSVSVLGNNDVIRGLDFAMREVQEKPLTLNRLAQQEGAPQPTLAVSAPPLIAGALPEVGNDTKSEPEEGKWFVQLGAYGSRELAQAFWDRVNGSLQAFDGKTPRFEDYRSMTRLLVGPGRSRGAANDLCEQVKAGNLDCLVRSVE